MSSSSGSHSRFSSSGPISARSASIKVLDFVPPKFEMGTPDQAQAYLETKQQGQDFRMSDVIRIQTGVKEIEAGNLDEKVDGIVLEKLKDIQESAYQEAYQLGLEEGKHDAIKAVSSEISAKLEKFDQLIKSCTTLKQDLLQFNEAHLVKLAMHMASRLANMEIKSDPNALVAIMRSALEIAQTEESVVVQISPQQFEFCESLKKETGREFEFLKNVKFEAVSEITEGGCIIETNYGEIDARIEERVARLWESMSESLPRVKDKLSAT